MPIKPALSGPVKSGFCFSYLTGVQALDFQYSLSSYSRQIFINAEFTRREAVVERFVSIEVAARLECKCKSQTLYRLRVVSHAHRPRNANYLSALFLGTGLIANEQDIEDIEMRYGTLERSTVHLSG